MTYRKLIEGFEKFRAEYFDSPRKSDYERLVKEGQQPETLVIACSDSRIDPAILTDSHPGEFFAIRNVAAIVPPYNKDGTLLGTSSAIEYAVRFLKVKHIVVLGHAGCGGIQALATENYQATEHHSFQFLNHWLGIGENAKNVIQNSLKDADPKELLTCLEKAMIVVSLENLLSFPWIKDKFDRQEIFIHGWYYDMCKGNLLEYDPMPGRFRNISTSQNTAKHNIAHYNLEHFSQNYLPLDRDQGD